MSKVTPIPCRCTCSCEYGDAVRRRSASPVDSLPQPPTQGVRVRFREEEEEEDARADEDEERLQSVALLRVRVRALEKYKTNYELLCGQLAELNAQIGLQLQRHESDVETLQATIEELQRAKLELEAQVADQREVVEQDRAYSQRMHRQLSAAAQLLKATEKRVESKEQQLLGELEDAREQLKHCQHRITELQTGNAALEAQLTSNDQQFRRQLERDAKKHAGAREKLKCQLEAATARCTALSEQLQQQRADSRDAKKLAGRAQSETEALRKQLSSAQQDAEHLSTILDSQRAEQDESKAALALLRRANRKLENKLATASCELEGLRTDVLAMQERLVATNEALATSQSDLKAAKTELQQRSEALERALSQHSSSDEEKNKAGEELRRREAEYQREVREMRQLLAAHARRAADSSKDVETLKHELEHVQTLLRAGSAIAREGSAPVARHAVAKVRRAEARLCRGQDSDEEAKALDESSDSWCDLLLASGKAEESVLRSAIMEQVRAFAA